MVLYSLLIDVHGKYGLVHEAMDLLKEMVANGIPPNVVTYNSLIDAYGRMGQVGISAFKCTLSQVHLIKRCLFLCCFFLL